MNLADHLARAAARFDLKDDTFSRTTVIQDWRNHVPGSLKDNWHALTIPERIVIAITAQYAADTTEDWD